MGEENKGVSLRCRKHLILEYYVLSNCYSMWGCKRNVQRNRRPPNFCTQRLTLKKFLGRILGYKVQTVRGREGGNQANTLLPSLPSPGSRQKERTCLASV